MCGIAAFIAKDSCDASIIKKMTDIIAYRGPDGDGHESFDNGRVWLGHRRLAIIDLSEGGKQPKSFHGKYSITYNGEIYNYVELREELKKLGYVFSTQSDTEVMLAAYDQWGVNCLNRFNGMFALVLFDKVRRKIFAARDRFGVKPLYYWRSPNGDLALASEIKQFSVLEGWKPLMNDQRVADFLGFSVYDHTDETMFKNVFQLRGGMAMEWEYSKNSDPDVYNWYTLAPREFRGTYADAVGEFLHLFTDSVRLRLRADVPVGSCLSGGLDSSSIVCIVNNLLLEQDAHSMQKTFSAYADITKYDESPFIKEVVASRDIDAYHITPPGSELMETFPKMAWHQDEPFGSTSIYAQWHVFKLAAQHSVKVMLDGQGSDEQLAGYYPFYGTRLAELVVNFRWIRFYKEFILSKNGESIDRWALLRRVANVMVPFHGPRSLVYRFRPESGTSWFNRDALAAKNINIRQVEGEYRANVNAACEAQMMRTNLPMLLHSEDRNSMAHSIEARVPFLDYRLVEFIMGLPSDFKIYDATTKRILRDSMHGILPEKIKRRTDKLGFVTPEEVWIKEYSSEFRIRLTNAIKASKGLLNQNLIADFDNYLGGKSKLYGQFVKALSLAEWMKAFKI